MDCDTVNSCGLGAEIGLMLFLRNDLIQVRSKLFYPMTHAGSEFMRVCAGIVFDKNTLPVVLVLGVSSPMLVCSDFRREIERRVNVDVLDG